MTEEEPVQKKTLNIQLNPAILAYVILTIFIVIAFLGQGILVHAVNDKDNKTRCAVAGLVFALSENSERNAKATVASKTATPEQKSAATANLANIAVARAQTEDYLGHPHGELCKPPQ